MTKRKELAKLINCKVCKNEIKELLYTCYSCEEKYNKLKGETND